MPIAADTTRAAPGCAIRLAEAGKCYHIYRRPIDRLKQSIWRDRRTYFREFWALRNVTLELGHGDVVGVVGRNGAGKSTLLQLVCGTVRPSHGQVSVNGRIAALLELGAGFNPEFTGRENVWMNASILGLTEAQIGERFDRIVAFSELEEFIDQPVRTYSSGMVVRLAFAVMVHVDPEILVIDEALSVGDGAFARKSFERVMQLRDLGRTILFCSHSLYQVEALCNKVIWLDRGQVAAAGDPATVLAHYKSFLDTGFTVSVPAHAPQEPAPVISPRGTARIDQVLVQVDGITGPILTATSGKSEVWIDVRFRFDTNLPTPHVGVAFTLADGTAIASAITHNDGVSPALLGPGHGVARIRFPNLALLKGVYWVYACILSEDAIHVYEEARHVARIDVSQQGLEQGYVTLIHEWSTT